MKNTECESDKGALPVLLKGAKMVFNISFKSIHHSAQKAEGRCLIAEEWAIMGGHDCVVLLRETVIKVAIRLLNREGVNRRVV